MNHRMLLVSEEDDDETRFCIDCGYQENRYGPIEELAQITGGWSATPVNDKEHEEQVKGR